MPKQTYRVVFETSWSRPDRVAKIVTTSDIEKSLARIRKALEGQVHRTLRFDPRLFKPKNYVTLLSVELLGRATIHA
jgi:hypothetical protein